MEIKEFKAEKEKLEKEIKEKLDKFASKVGEELSVVVYSLDDEKKFRVKISMEL